MELKALSAGVTPTPKSVTPMTQSTTRLVSAVAACAAFWAVLNALISPVFWQLTHMPFLCDFLAFTSLTLVVWWTRKLGSAMMTGVIVTILTFTVQPGSFQMLGFVIASFAFDLLTRAAGYGRLFDKSVSGAAFVIVLSTVCAALAGALIGAFMMGLTTLPAVLTFAGLHAIGGIAGGAVGVATLRALTARKIAPYQL